jgi:hypothetical protein
VGKNIRPEHGRDARATVVGVEPDPPAGTVPLSLEPADSLISIIDSSRGTGDRDGGRGTGVSILVPILVSILVRSTERQRYRQR